MRQRFKIVLLASLTLLVTSCGQRSSGTRFNGVRSVSAGENSVDTRRGISTVLRSGTTGSPSNANNSGTGQAAPVAGSAPVASNPSGNSVFNNTANAFSGVDFWGNLVQNTATDPQQCADLYNKYQRFPGNFEAAFSVLGACLNRVMIVKNPNLFQGYMYLTQQQYGYSSY